MSRTWDHTLSPLQGEARAKITFSEPSTYEPNAPVTKLHECASCPIRAKRPATWLATYSYVTGKMGRVSSARKRLCSTHAQAYAQKYGVPFDVVAEDVVQ
jgi:hypothetical protein